MVELVATLVILTIGLILLLFLKPGLHAVRGARRYLHHRGRSGRALSRGRADRPFGLGVGGVKFVLAAVMMLVMVSMIGVPPLAGFYAKWWVIAALVDAGLLWLAIAAVVFSVIGAFYYLRVIKLMYFDDCVDRSPLSGGFGLRLVLSLNGVAVLALGLFPDGLIDVCARALM